MRFLLDTNICIELIRRRNAKVLGRLRRHAVGEVAISTITLAELAYGVEKSARPEQNRIALSLFCAPLDILLFDDAAATAYGVVRADLERKGRPIGPMDLLIAAHALSAGLVLVTNNEREFRRARGLRVENWV
ncbi:MAG TPA: type II toxin-antitoxin system VapC family toxin [Candidatus Hydrogenedentes bacterium]|nr:type II toxin-antitoxin system VapC family toxin [Candidatus Hydrogenedentota bacterium]